MVVHSPSMNNTNTNTKPAEGTQSAKMTFWNLIAQLGCHVEPYPGGAQVFIGRADVAQPALYRQFWNLSDARVVGTLSGPSLHMMGNVSR